MKQEKVTFIHSISAKITLLAVFIVVVSLVGSVINASSKSRKVVENVNSNYILSLAEMGAQTIGNIPADIATDEEYSKIISEINMTGVESAYAYLVSEDGTMIYHPTADKIGQPVENTVVKEVVSQLASGTVPEDNVVEYEFNGGIKYAGYALTPDHMIVVVTADKDEIVKPVNQMIWSMSITAGITLVVCVIIGYLLSRFICTPLEHLTEIIKNTADLNFSHNAKSDGLCKRTDETGFMARELRVMRRNLREMVANIDTASQQITGNVDGLKQVTETVDHMCSDNSATSQQLAAGMQETAATTVNINENVGTMKEEADRLTEMAEKGADVSNEVMDRAKNLCNKTVTASNRTMEMYTNVKEKSEKAIEGSKAVEKINELKVDLIVLAGYLVKIPEEMVHQYSHRIINIHPSLIPSFCGVGYYGLHVHEAVLEKGVKVTGATVHYVDEGMDTGEIIAQKPVMVEEGDTPEILQKRVMEQAEWKLLPAAINMIANQK